MNYITEQVQSIFSEKQEWESFLLLCKNKDAIRNDWFLKLRSKLNEMALKNIPNDWGFISWGFWDFRWFVKNYGADSLSIWQLGNQNYNSLCIWANGNLFDRKKIFNLLQENKYSVIKSSFARIDEVFNSDVDFRFIERGNYSFEGEASNGNLDIDKLAWYANYKTEELAIQIIEKVNKFIQNPEITKMFIEINELSKIK